jgi:hypothetical protein
MLGVIAARLVIVGKDDDISAFQMGHVLRSPLARTSGIAGGDNAEPTEAVTVLLALGHEYGVPTADCFDHIRQPVGHDRHPLHIPGAVCPALSKVFGIVAKDFKQQLA